MNGSVRKLVLLVTAASASGCIMYSEGNYRAKAGDTYVIRAKDAASVVDEAAFRICRDRHQSGYQVIHAPSYDVDGPGYTYRGVVHCTGPVDTSLASQYRESKFTVVGQSGDYHFFEIK